MSEYDECPFIISAASGVPLDSVRAARVQRFMNWKWKTDPEFRAEIRRNVEAGMSDWVDRLVYGAKENLS